MRSACHPSFRATEERRENVTGKVIHSQEKESLRNEASKEHISDLYVSQWILHSLQDISVWEANFSAILEVRQGSITAVCRKGWRQWLFLHCFIQLSSLPELLTQVHAVGVQVNFADYSVRNIWQHFIANTDLWRLRTTHFISFEHFRLRIEAS